MIPRPTGEELMMFVDGELDPVRAAEVQAFVESDPDARATVEALGIAGEIVSESALERADRAGASDVADRLMHAIEADRAGVVDLGARRRGRLTRPWAFAGPAWATLAVAAAVAIWVNVPKIHPDTGPMVMIGSANKAIEKTAAVVAATSAEVDAVDFGARAGSIFYVPSDGVGTTAVVWLTDDDGVTRGERR
jgi:anti-sigma factor RsiW